MSYQPVGLYRQARSTYFSSLKASRPVNNDRAKNVHRTFTALALASMSLFGTSTTFAQSDVATTTDIEDMIVIGTRQAYQGDFAPLEIPQAELVIDARTLKDAGALDLVQALDLSASISRQNNFGGLWNSFAVRGFVGDENLPSNYLVNGFNAGRGFGGARDLSGIESVEVLKGPRAALFGRGEPGGTINLTTKRPTFETDGAISVSAGRFNAYRTDIDYTTPLSETVAIRLVGFYEDAESFRDTVETKKLGFSPSIAWHINESTQLVYELEYNTQEVPFDRGVVAVGLTGEEKVLGVIPQSRFLGEPGDGPIDTQVVGHQLEFQHDFNSNWSALVGFNFRDTSLEGFATENGFFGSRQFLEVDGENLSRFRRERDYNATYQVFRAELSGAFQTGPITHKVIIGVDSDEFENDQVIGRVRGGTVASGISLEDALAINIFEPVYGAYPLPEVGPNADVIEIQESIGLFVQDQISLTDKLDIRLGARLDDYEQALTNRASGDVSEFTETQISPQFGVVYKASDVLSLYAAYGENFRPLSGATAENELEPNQSESAEIGVKFTLNNGALEGTISVFNIEQSNISTVDENFVATAIGEAESNGLEIDLAGSLTDSLSVWASFAYIDATTENDFNDPNFGSVVPAGSRLLNIPEHQVSLQLVQEVEVAGRELDLIGGLLFVDDRNGFFSDQDFILPSYTTVQIAADYALSESVAVRAEIQNLFDEEHFTNSFADVWVQPGTPRSYRVSLDLQF